MATRAKKVDVVFPPGTAEYAFFQTGTRGAEALAEKYARCEDVHRAAKYVRDLLPSSVLEIGSGIGRASVYLHKALGMDGVSFDLLDGNVGRKRALKEAKRCAGTYGRLGEGYYNSLKIARRYCEANGLSVGTYDAAEYGPGRKQIPKTYHLALSFKAVGFHWPVREYLEWLHDMLLPGALVIFEVRSHASGMWEFTEDQIMTTDGFVQAGKYEIVKVPSKREKFPLLVLSRS